MSYVGIFWFVPANLFGLSALVTDQTPLALVTPRGRLIIHDRSHEAYWSDLAALGRNELRRRGLPTVIATAGFAEFPRGRIEFDSDKRAFAIHADHSLQDGEFMRYVRAIFAIPSDRHTVDIDPEYTSSRPIGPPKPWY